MGREIRRVPLDFDHPLRERWPGFICNEGGPCPETSKTCFNGQTAAGAWLDAICRFLETAARESLVPDERRQAYAAEPMQRIYPHPYLKEFPQAPHFLAGNGRWNTTRHLVPLTQELGEFLIALSGDKTLGHTLGSGGSWSIQKALMKKAKAPKDWGACPVCGGEGDDPAKRAAAAAWKRTPPPAGDGWQLWETVTEGSPISPVFKTAVGLERWLVEQGYTPGAAHGMVEEGWVPSMTAEIKDGKLVNLKADIEALDP